MTEANDESGARWQPLEAIDRRVLGVLIEKAKTTPDNYPLSLSALKSGCNQKSNRFPQMQLEDDPIEESLERLRTLGAVSFVQGTSRVDKFRHLAYDWLGVDKVEIAVMAELLLRGAQTVGELRGRAARMEAIKGLDELRPVLDALETKGLVLYLTPKGRGAMVTHALYQPQEMDKVRRDVGANDGAGATEAGSLDSGNSIRRAPPAVPTSSEMSELAQLRTALDSSTRELRAEIQSLRSDLETLKRDLGN